MQFVQQGLEIAIAATPERFLHPAEDFRQFFLVRRREVVDAAQRNLAEPVADAVHVYLPVEMIAADMRHQRGFVIATCLGGIFLPAGLVAFADQLAIGRPILVDRLFQCRRQVVGAALPGIEEQRLFQPVLLRVGKAEVDDADRLIIDTPLAVDVDTDRIRAQTAVDYPLLVDGIGDAAYRHQQAQQIAGALERVIERALRCGQPLRQRIARSFGNQNPAFGIDADKARHERVCLVEFL